MSTRSASSAWPIAIAERSVPPRPSVVTVPPSVDALKARNDGYRAAFERVDDRARLDSQNPRVAVPRVGYNAGLRTGERDRVDAVRRELVGEYGGRDEFAGGQQQIGVGASGAAGDERQQRIGRVRFGSASHRRNDGDRRKARFARVAHAATREPAFLGRRERAPAELENGRFQLFTHTSLGEQQLEDLHRVGCRSATQLVADAPQREVRPPVILSGVEGSTRRRATCTSSVPSTSRGVTIPSR